jgi:hypothetical protein
LESSVFTEIESGPNKGIYIGKEKIPNVLRSLLRDESKNIQTTRLWEIMNASVINEAYNLALMQSTDFEQVNFAKALKHWSFFMMNVMKILEKND